MALIQYPRVDKLQCAYLFGQRHEVRVASDQRRDPQARITVLPLQRHDMVLLCVILEEKDTYSQKKNCRRENVYLEEGALFNDEVRLGPNDRLPRGRV